MNCQRFKFICFLAILFIHTAAIRSQPLGEKPGTIPKHWRGLIGEYVSESDTVLVLEKDDRLHLLFRHTEYQPLREQSKDTYEYAQDKLRTVIFSRSERGVANSLEIGSVNYGRNAINGEDDQTFKIVPLKPLDELRAIALAALPPVEKGDFFTADLVELTKLDSTIKLDIRYASTNNFANTAFYSQARAFLQRPAAEALVRVHQTLKRKGYGILIHDAYRPWYVTKMFWDATPDDKKIFVADPTKGSRHNRGCAVDLSLYDLITGRPVEIVSGYDEFSQRAYSIYPGGTSLQRWHRALLRQAMEQHGFSVYEWEWWHFDYGDWNRYRIGTMTFEELQNVKN